MAARLFVYGTLNPDRAPDEVSELVHRLKRVGSGQVRGRLYNLGDYPGVVLDPKAPPVKGEVFSLPGDRETLSQLDAYEEFTPDRPDQSLFLRRKTRVTLEDGTHSLCWIYVYNRPIPAIAPASGLATVA